MTVEENLALFATVHWDRRAITYLNVQALWAAKPLRDFITDGEGEHRYLRLDMHPEEPGPLLKEPIPHVHTVPKGEPRLAIPSTDRTHPIGWFIDFIYRNFYYEDVWSTWAEELWQERCTALGRPNSWPRLMKAFESGQLAVIQNNATLMQDFRDLNGLVRQRRAAFYPLGIAPHLHDFGDL